MGRFEDDYKLGSEGVAIVRGLLRSGHPVTVEDVQPDPEWQRRGVDLLCWRGGTVVSIEVKFERRDSQNFALEAISNTRTGRPGWWQTCEADVLFYGFQTSGRWWVLHLGKLRRELRGARWEGLRSVHAHTPGSHTTRCRLLPIAQAVAIDGAERWSGALPERYLARRAPRPHHWAPDPAAPWQYGRRTELAS